MQIVLIKWDSVSRDKLIRTSTFITCITELDFGVLLLLQNYTQPVLPLTDFSVFVCSRIGQKMQHAERIKSTEPKLNCITYFWFVRKMRRSEKENQSENSWPSVQLLTRMMYLIYWIWKSITVVYVCGYVNICVSCLPRINDDNDWLWFKRGGWNGICSV